MFLKIKKSPLKKSSDNKLISKILSKVSGNNVSIVNSPIKKKQQQKPSFFALCLFTTLTAAAITTSTNITTSEALQPTAAQIEQFKKLSPQEQKKLAQSFGVEIPQGIGGAATVSPVQSPQTVTPRAVNDEESHSGDQDQPGHTEVKKQQAKEAKINSGASKALSARANLKPFGYDLFAGAPSTFAPATDIPVPVNYAVGPGDTIVVQLYGKENETHELIVTREGVIQFPGIGPISINGLNFSELRARIDNLVSEQMIGVKASVTMGALRSIHVFVLGEAYQPGTYTISSLSTITHALFASGGIKTIGSLRNIQLKRQGKVIATLDLYDLLLNGDTSDDRHLLPGDVIFIPPVGTTASITGEVKRPAIYELKGPSSTKQLVQLAGGYKPTAYPKASRIDRIDAQGRRTVVDIDLKSNRGQQRTVQNGDLITVYSVLDKLENIVMLSGHLHRPGHFTWRPGMRVRDLIPSISDLKANPDLNIALIKQEHGPERRIQFKQFSPQAMLANPGNHADNPKLQPRDEIILFEAGSDRRVERLAPYIDRLSLQSLNAQYPAIVEIQGSVKAPGRYPLTHNMNSAQLIALAGGLQPDARQGKALLINKTKKIGRYQTELIHLEQHDRFNAKPLMHASQLLVLSNEEAADREEILKPVTDKIQSQSWHGEASPVISITGPVRFPGLYPYIQEMNVEQLLDLAGGLREEAYLYSAEVTRRHIEVGRTFEVRHHTLDLGREDATGRQHPLQPRDNIVVKRVPEWGENITVTINGEVRFPGVYPIVRGETLVDLIDRAGGFTEYADPVGTVFLREALREKEQAALEDYQEQLESEVARLEQEALVASEEIAKQKSGAARLLEELEGADAQGRLVIDLVGMLDGKRDAVVLSENDSIVIPRLIQEVSIVGEVNQPTSYLYQRGINGKGYINLSGGVGKNGDLKRAYIIGRDGTVERLRKFNLLGWKFYNRVKAGDTIVVPVDTEKVSVWTYWVQASQVLFQLATTVAALDTVGAL